MLYSGTDPETNIPEYTLVYEEKYLCLQTFPTTERRGNNLKFFLYILKPGPDSGPHCLIVFQIFFFFITLEPRVE